MNITCPHCKTQHQLPDSDVEGKKFHFFCDACKNKVTVDYRRARTLEVNSEKNNVIGHKPSQCNADIKRKNIASYCGSGLRITGILAWTLQILVTLLIFIFIAGIIRKASLMQYPVVVTVLVWLAFTASICVYQVQSLYGACFCNTGLYSRNSGEALRFFLFDVKGYGKLVLLFTVIPLVLALPLCVVVFNSGLPVQVKEIAGFVLGLILVEIIIVMLVFPIFAGFAGSRSMLPRRLLDEFLKFFRQYLLYFPAVILVVELLSVTIAFLLMIPVVLTALGMLAGIVPAALDTLKTVNFTGLFALERSVLFSFAGFIGASWVLIMSIVLGLRQSLYTAFCQGSREKIFRELLIVAIPSIIAVAAIIIILI